MLGPLRTAESFNTLDEVADMLEKAKANFPSLDSVIRSFRENAVPITETPYIESAAQQVVECMKASGLLLERSRQAHRTWIK